MLNGITLSKFFLINPFKRGMIETVLLIGTGILGLIFSWYNFSMSPYTNITGGVLIVLSFLFHWWTEKDHQQAHHRSDKIEHIVNKGVYSKIRHPLYLSMIVFNIGIALSFGVLVTLILALITVIHWTATAYMEEKMLLTKFQTDYSQYQQSVRWRMIPGLF